MWIAHSYIRSCGSKSTEDLGNAFIQELYRRSFLTKVRSSEWDAQEYFTMHDLIHDLARSILAGEFCTIAQENVGIVSAEVDHHTEYFGIIAQSRCRRSLMRKLITNNACRNFVSEIASYISDLMGLRVLKLSFSHAHVLRYVANLKHLRYLELEGLDSKLERLPSSISLLYNLVVLKLVFLKHLIELPFNIEKLLNLRFLSIHFVGIRELPESLGQLCNLQCLSVGDCRNLKKLPTNIGNLTNLKQLYISYLEIRELPESLCMLRKLQTLFLYGCRGLKQLPNSIGNLTNLRRIIFSKSCIKTLPKSISCLHNLEIMELDCSGSHVALLREFEGLLNKSSLNFSIKKLGQNFSVEDLVIKNSIKQSLMLNGPFLFNLASLEIRNSWKLETLEVLSVLKLLKILVLWDCPRLQLNKPGDGSRIYLPPYLQSLAVHGCHSMLSLDLPVHDPSFLIELEITDCKLLMHIDSLHELTQLETLAIIQCPHLRLELLPTVPDCVVISKCPRLKAWCEMHSIEPLDN